MIFINIIINLLCKIIHKNIYKAQNYWSYISCWLMSNNISKTARYLQKTEKSIISDWIPNTTIKTWTVAADRNQLNMITHKFLYRWYNHAELAVRKIMMLLTSTLGLSFRTSLSMILVKAMASKSSASGWSMLALAGLVPTQIFNIEIQILRHVSEMYI